MKIYTEKNEKNENDAEIKVFWKEHNGHKRVFLHHKGENISHLIELSPTQAYELAIHLRDIAADIIGCSCKPAQIEIFDRVINELLSSLK